MWDLDFFLLSKGLELLTYSPLILFGLLEEFIPRRQNSIPLRVRWTANISLQIINYSVLRWLFPATALGLAMVAQGKGIGFFNIIECPYAVKVFGGFLLWDFSGYIRHRLFHLIPALWRTHQVHHADLDFDVTTAIRHHPLEAILGTIWDMGVLMLLGIDPLLWIIYGTAQFMSAAFNHANLAIPLKIDHMLRWIIVTPDMHRIHHSNRHPESERNFGNLFSFWDRLFASYQDSPALGHIDMKLGLQAFSQESDQNLWKQILIPFTKRKRTKT